jgi:hypothetical protein
MNGENEITDEDREIEDALAARFGYEPNYESSARMRREVESVTMYMSVYGLSPVAGQALVTADDLDRYSIKEDVQVPAVVDALTDVRRLAWEDGDPRDIGNALTIVHTAIRDEQARRR